MATHFSPPDDFRCPISLEIMSDPVILSSGHTFDRSSIQRWLDSGNRTCPITKQPVPHHFTLIPNHALRSLISSYSQCSDPNPGRNLEPQSFIYSLDAKDSCVEVKAGCLRQMNRLCRKDSVFRKKVMECSGVSAVLRCVAAEEASLRELALTLLLNLSLDDDNKVGLVAEGAVGKVVGSLRGGNSSCRALAATMLTSLAMVEVNKGTIGAYPNAIGLLVSLLRCGKGRERKEAATALYVLCSFRENKKRAVGSGAVEVLVEMADTGVERAVEVLVEMADTGFERAVEVLGLLAKCGEGRGEMGRCEDCVSVLVRALRNGSERSVVHALLALNSLCDYNEELRLEVMKMGGLDICLGLVDDENEKISKNSTTLIRTLGWRRLKD